MGRHRPLLLSILYLLPQLNFAQVVSNSHLILESDSPNVLHPNYINVASGKKIAATATCGYGPDGKEPQSQIYCKLTGGGNQMNYEFLKAEKGKSILQGQHCDVCQSDLVEKAHPIEYAIDGTEKWWQSPPLSQGVHYNELNITIDLGQLFHVAYVIVKFANTPRAGTWVLERSTDYGKTWSAWQYFAESDSNCMSDFGKNPYEPILLDDQVICTSQHSDVVPLENGEVIVSLINGREGAKNYSHAPLLQEFTKATNVRLRLLRTKTLLGHLMAVQREDSTVTRRYFYSIKDISIGGRCECNGHADKCIPANDNSNRLVCKCKHNTCGDSCDKCCPGFEQKKWAPAVPKNPNICEPCNCHGHSDKCVYNETVNFDKTSMDMHGNYEGGGVCQNCRHNTAGINCEKCAEGFFRPDNVPIDSPNACQPCNCNSEHTVGTCEPLTGRCYCKKEYAGDKCDRCAEGYYDFPSCKKCDCYYEGTENGNCFPETSNVFADNNMSENPMNAVSDMLNPDLMDDLFRDDVNTSGSCNCKDNYQGRLCDSCAVGFYQFPSCEQCDCDGPGVENVGSCDTLTGACTCRTGYRGEKCDQCETGYYNYPLCSPCPCSQVGTTENVCDRDSGECICADTYAGARCDKCQPGYYGFPTCQPCPCTGQGVLDHVCDSQTGQCKCHDGYAGRACDQCAQNFYSYPSCEPCGCNSLGSITSSCDQTTGQCSCRNNIEGRRCDQCVESYFNYPVCEVCSCDVRGIVYRDPSTCPAFIDNGQCPCKNNVSGMNCDACQEKYWNLNEDNPEGCEECNCYKFGTINGMTECDQEEGTCRCREYADGNRQCSSCRPGFYALNDKSYFGCDGCQCDVGGAFEQNCEQFNGQCSCRANTVGRRCDDVEYGYCYPTLYQYIAEFENGITPSGLESIRYGFNETRFPGFSFRGYAEMSAVQSVLIVPIEIPKSRLFRALINYVNENDHSLDAIMSTVSLYDGKNTTNILQDGLQEGENFERIQQFQVLNFRPTKDKPGTLMANVPLVLNQGLWSVSIEAENSDGLLLDNIILLPNEYYEPGILQKHVTQACQPDVIGEKCIKYTHLDFPVSAVRHEFDPTDGSKINAETDEAKLSNYAMLVDDESMQQTLTVPESGEYVLVLSYKTLRAEDKKQQVNLYIEVSDDEGGQYAAFNIYSCNYISDCRQVALNEDDLVFTINIKDTTVDMQFTATGWLGENGPKVFIKDITAIPIADWHRQYVVPSRECISEGIPSEYSSEHINFDCETSRWTVPPTAIEVFPETENVSPYTAPDTDITHDVHLLEGSGSIEGSTKSALFFGQLPALPLGIEARYVVILHYFQVDHLPYEAYVEVDSYPGRAEIQYCPDVSGCRVVVECSNTKELKLLKDSVSVNVRIPEGKILNIKSVIIVPAYKYDDSILKHELVDLSSKFIKECGANGFRNLPGEIEEDSFCHKAVKSLSLYNNDGAFACNCAAAGTIDGQRDTCESFGCQCPCRENVIGIQCTECATGYYGYPECKPCNCGSGICDPITGTCLCPPNTNEDCTICQENYFQFHPILGCADCECNYEGSINLNCEVDSGQCECLPHITGRKCDRCEDGYWGFPDCRPCECNEAGSTLTTCDANGSCLCKENVKGRQCSYCKDSTFNLEAENPFGCTECFCFGAFGPGQQPVCQSARYAVDAYYDDYGWKLLGIENDPNEGEPDQQNILWVYDIIRSDTLTQEDSVPYWQAPNGYLGNKISAYGGKMSWMTKCQAMQSSDFEGSGDYQDMDCRGDNCDSVQNPGYNYPVTVDCQCQDRYKYMPDLIISGSHMHMDIVYTHAEQFIDYNPEGEIQVSLLERNFKWSDGRPLAREDFMMVLVDIDAIKIKATCSPDFESLGIQSAIMEHVNFNNPTDYSGLPSVEECRCPEGYIGSSCESCDQGYYRETAGRYLGQCLPCKCSGNCKTCGADGLPRISELQNDCLDHTTGTYCEECEFGFIKEVETGKCNKCPCPLPTDTNSFADQCWHIPDEVLEKERSDAMLDKAMKVDIDAVNPVGNYSVNTRPQGTNNDLISDLLGEDYDDLGNRVDIIPNSGIAGAGTVSGDGVISGLGNSNTGGVSGSFSESSDMDTTPTKANPFKIIPEKKAQQVYCQCNVGYTGDNCSECETGFWGNPLVYGSKCQPCDCNGNSPTCNKDTGVCDDCDGNTGGDHCEICADWYFGDASQFCEICLCDQCGSQSCDKYSGYCTCKDHVVGEYCDMCADGYWNFPLTCESESSGCQKCECSGFALDDNCDKNTGQCNCPPNVVGKNCDECAPDHWGLSEEGCTPCDCPGMPCNPKTGQCDCPAGISGRQCDTCESERSVIRTDTDSGELYCYECNNCVDHLLDDLFLYQKESQLYVNYNDLREISQGTLAWKRLAVANSSYINTKHLKDMIESRVDLVLNTGEQFKQSENQEYLSDNDSTFNTNALAETGEDYAESYEYSYINYFDEDIEIGELLKRGKSIFNKSNYICKIIDQTKTESEDTIANSEGYKENYEKIFDGLHSFRTDAQTVAAELRDKIDNLSDEKFYELMRKASQDLQLIRVDSEPILALTPVAQSVFDKSADVWNRVQQNYPVPSDKELTTLVSNLEIKIGSLRDLLVYGQEIQNTVNDIGNQQDGYIQQISQTQTETSLMIIDTNNLLKDMVKVTNETANLIKSIVQHSSKMTQRGKDISNAIITLSHPKYNNFSWYEDVDQSLRIARNYAEYSAIRIQNITEPFDRIYPLYSNIIGTVGNISDIAKSLNAAEMDSSYASDILASWEILTEKAKIEKQRADQLHQDALQMEKTLKALRKASNDRKKRDTDEIVEPEIVSPEVANVKDDPLATSVKISEVEDQNREFNEKILSIDTEITELVKAVSNEQSKDLSDIVLQAEIQAQETHKIVTNRFLAIGAAYNQSKAATEKLNEAVETQQSFNLYLDYSGDIVRDLQKNEDDAKQGMDTDFTSEVIEKLQTVEALIEGFDLTKTIDDCTDLVTGIEKELDFAIQTAKLFRYSMEFKGNDMSGKADYVQPHLPLQIKDLADRTSISFSARIQPQDSTQGVIMPNNGLLMYLGGKSNDTSTDYMALELHFGRVRLHFRINGGYGRINTDNIIFKSTRWRHISISRFGNYATLNITKPNGDVVETQSGRTQGSGRSFYTAKDFNDPVIYFGGFPSYKKLPTEVKNEYFYGHIDSVMVNDHDIALWYFKNKKTSENQVSFDSTAPSSTQAFDSKCYFFDGAKSFFQIPYNYFRTKNHGFGVTFQFLTLQKNALRFWGFEGRSCVKFGSDFPCWPAFFIPFS